MPPKRRKAAEDALDQDEPKKRTTRSETRAKELKKEETATKHPETKEKPTPKTSQKPNPTTPASEPSTKKASTKPSPPTKKSPTTKPTKYPNPSNVQVLPTSPLIKSPLQCHFYMPPASTFSRPRDTLIFTHGAGGTLSAPSVENFCTGYSTSYPVLGFQGSMNLAARTAGFHACVEHIDEGGEEEENRRRDLVLGGRSMGARAAVIAGTEILASASQTAPKSTNTATEKISPPPTKFHIQLVLISYPLRSPKGAIRDEILLALPAEVEVLFIIGDADAMCPLELLDEVRGKMRARSRLVVVRGADHGMGVKPAKRTKGVGEETGRVAARWVSGGTLGEGDGDDGVVYIGEEEGEEE